MPGFLEQILNFALLTGAPLVLLLDLLVLFFLTTHFQKKHPANWSLRLNWTRQDFASSNTMFAVSFFKVNSASSFFLGVVGKVRSYSIPSVLCFMNPLLECGNPFTIPSWLYFTWRWVQLFGMAGVALYLVSCRRLRWASHFFGKTTNKWFVTYLFQIFPDLQHC